MISINCDILEFLRTVEGKDDLKIIEMADREATEAERCLYRQGATEAERSACGQAYANHLKNLIFFIRYGIRPSGTDAQHLAHFRSVCNAESPAAQQPSPPTRTMN